MSLTQSELAGGASAYAFSRHHGINPWNGTRIQRPEPPRVEGIRVRHHTDRNGMRGIRRDGFIRAARGDGEGDGVFVELPPFRNPADVDLGQNGRGAYVEFTHPENNIQTPRGFLGGNGNAGRIPTRVPLNIENANSTYRWWRWWDF